MYLYAINHHHCHSKKKKKKNTSICPYLLPFFL